MCRSGGKGGDGGAAAREAARRQRIQQGTASIDAAFGQFTPEYYSGIESAYVDYAMPQLERQYQEALKQLAFALERSGIQASTGAGSKQAQMEEQYNKYRTDIASAGRSYADRARQDTESSRAQLMSQLSATEDPAAAATGAARFAETASRPPTFDPIGSFVFDVAQEMKQKSDQSGYKPLVGTQLFQSKNPATVTYRN